MKKLIMLAMALGLLVSGCSMNTNPPDYIKNLQCTRKEMG